MTEFEPKKAQVLIDTLLRADKDLHDLKVQHKEAMRPVKTAYSEALKAVQEYIPDGTRYDHDQDDVNDVRGESATITVNTLDEKKSYTKKDYENNIKSYYMQSNCFGNIQEDDADELASSMLQYFKDNPRIVRTKKVVLKRKKPGRTPDATKQSRS